MTDENLEEIPEDKKKAKKKDKETDNFLDGNVFKLRLKTDKEIELRPYSFSIQIKLMKSGMLNKLAGIQKTFQVSQIDMENVDFIKIGELMELSLDIIYEMLPKGIQLKTEKEKLIDDVDEAEPMRFINWIVGQYGKNNAFLGQENLVEAKSNELNQ